MADVPVPSIVTATPDGDDTVLGVKDGLVRRFTLDNVGAGINFSAINATTNMAFKTNGTEKMRLDSAGNLGIGVTPSAWATYKALQVGQLGAMWANPSGTDVYWSANYYFGAGSDRYIANGLASYYRQIEGVHSWGVAPSGTAGNAITFTQAMTLDASGNLGIGTSSPTQKLDVAGIGRFYSDMGGNFGGGFVLENSASGATNGAKNFRISPTGTLQLINSAYSAVIHEFYNDGSFLASGNISAPAFYDSGNTAFYLDPANTGTSMVVAGNVGIGTTSPSTKLQVRGTGAQAIRVSTDSSGNPSLVLAAEGVNGGSVSYDRATQALQLESGGTTALSINSAGNIIANVNGTAPTLATNSTMSFELTSNTSLKIVVRGTDGTTRSTTLTLS
jgi:hypothetical protein